MADTENSIQTPEPWPGTPGLLFRPVLGTRLAAVFLLFLVLTIGNLIFIRILYDDIDEGIHVIDQAGRLRYLGQAVALQAAWAAERPGRDGAPLAKAIAEFEQALAASEQAVRRLCPKILLEAPTVFPRLQALLNLAFVLAAYVFMRRRIIRPVAELSSVTRRFVVGNYGARVGFSSRDEFGELAAPSMRPQTGWAGCPRPWSRGQPPW